MKKIIALVATASLMFSCSQEVTPDLEKFPINISVGQQTRATDTTFDSGDEVGIYVVNYDDSTAGSLKATGNQVDNMRFTYRNSSWTPDETIYWKDKTTAADFYAYYPYSASPNISAHPFAVKADQSEEADFWASDFLWGKTNNVSPTSSAVPIETNHSLSRILVNVVPGEGFADAWGNAAVSVKICDVNTSATIDLATGVATATGEKGEIVPLAVAETGTTLSYKAMMIPQVVADNSKLVVVTVDGVDYIYRKGYEFKANTEHKFTVSVNKTGGSVEMSIGEWTIDDTTNEGDAEEESESEATIPNNEIWYTVSDERPIVLRYEDVFGANLISNTYEKGKGILQFDGDVTSIGQAFNGISTSYTVTIPGSVLEIGASAFSYSNVTNVILSEGTISIADRAFAYSPRLASITIPNSVERIGANVFYGCSDLIEFNGKYASEDKKCLIVDGALIAIAHNGLTAYSIPEGVTSIGNAIFSGCSTLESITIPNGVAEISSQAFYGCSNLSSVNLPNSIEIIRGGAFDECVNLKEIIIPESVIKIEGSAFSRSGITSINIPQSVKEIGNSVFATCADLESVTLVEGITTIGEYAFDDCSSLTSITIPNSVTNIGKAPFFSCENLIEINSRFASEDKRCLIINGYLIAFAPKDLTAYSIPDGVTNIVGDAFAFTNLTTIHIPESVTSIGYGAFRGSSNITDIYCNPITPPTGNDYMFGDLNESAKIYVPAESVDNYKNTIDWSAYANYIEGYDSKNVESTIPNNQIWYTAIAKIDLNPSNNTEAFDVAISSHEWDSATSKGVITFDGDVTSIGCGAFVSCNFTDIVLPNSVISIGDTSFAGSSITSIVIPNGVQTIEANAFRQCSSLENVYFKSTTPPTIGENVFVSVWSDEAGASIPAENLKIYVPAASVNSYKEASDNWIALADKIFADPTEN